VRTSPRSVSFQFSDIQSFDLLLLLDTILTYDTHVQMAFNALPIELILEVGRYLDQKSLGNWRKPSPKLYWCFETTSLDVNIQQYHSYALLWACEKGDSNLAALFSAEEQTHAQHALGVCPRYLLPSRMGKWCDLSSIIAKEHREVYNFDTFL